MHDDFQQLFETNSFFSYNLLSDTLKIPPDLQYLFFEFCEVQSINQALLADDKQLQLLDKLIELSKSFRLIVENHKTTKQN